MTSPFFSVVIPTYNRVSEVLRAIDSFHKVDYAAKELIVVENGSLPAVKIELEASVNADQLLDLSVNQGPGGARNAGAKVAKGDFLIFLDSDDELLPSTMATFQRAIKAHPDACLFGGMPENLAPKTAANEFAFHHFDNFLDSDNPFFILLPSGVTIKTTDFHKSGGFLSGTGHMEDMDLWFRIGTGVPFVGVAAPGTYRRNIHDACRSYDADFAPNAVDDLIKMELTGRYMGTDEQGVVRRSTIRKVVEFYKEHYANLQQTDVYQYLDTKLQELPEP